MFILRFCFLLLISAPFLYSQKIPAGFEKAAEHNKILSSDEYEGRKPGTASFQKSIDYITNAYSALGLKMFSSSYKQDFNFVSGLEHSPNSKTSFSVFVPRPGVPDDKIKPREKSWNVGTDWLAFGTSSNKTIENAPLAFVGFGISAPELNYDDYKDIDVSGKVAIIITENPDASTDYKGEVIHKKDSKFNQFSRYTYKAETAKAKGAVGVIFVKILGDSADVLEPTEYFAMSNELGIVAIQAKRTSISEFFPKKDGLPIVEKEIKDKKQPKSFILPNVKVNINVDLKKIESPTSNLIAYIEGTEAKYKNEYIIIGAHYDHIGLGGLASQNKKKYGDIHNGADDNASGVAGMLELAERIKNNPLSRPVIFIAFSAEEMGLLGAKHFTANPIIPLKEAVAMINLDMIGRMTGNTLNIYGEGSSDFWKTNIDALGAESQVKIVYNNFTQNLSDHAPFYRMSVPVLHLFTDLHEDYHRPSDDFAKLNIEGMKKIVDFGEKLIRKLAAEDKKINFKMD